MPLTKRTSRGRRGFSLIELVIVVVIIGIIGAIAIPRLSRGAGGANASALKQDLAVMNKAIELYAAEHGGAYPTVAQFDRQMLTYTNAAGTPRKATGDGFIYGPYLRAIPPAPGGESPGSRIVSNKPTEGVGWVYDESAGRIVLNRGGATAVKSEDSALNVLLDGLGL